MWRGEVVKWWEEKLELMFGDGGYGLEEVGKIGELVLKGEVVKEEGMLVFEDGKKDDLWEDGRFLEERS